MSDLSTRTPSLPAELEAIVDEHFNDEWNGGSSYTTSNSMREAVAKAYALGKSVPSETGMTKEDRMALDAAKDSAHFNGKFDKQDQPGNGTTPTTREGSAEVSGKPGTEARHSDKQRASESGPRPCTCHPDDNPPRPCPQKFALSECRAAAGTDDKVERPDRLVAHFRGIADAIATAPTWIPVDIEKKLVPVFAIGNLIYKQRVDGQWFYMHTPPLPSAAADRNGKDQA